MEVTSNRLRISVITQLRVKTQKFTKQSFISLGSNYDNYTKLKCKVFTAQYILLKSNKYFVINSERK